MLARLGLAHGEWGVTWRALSGASRGAILFTLPGIALILAAGWALGTLHDRRDARHLRGARVLLDADRRPLTQKVVRRSRHARRPSLV